MNRKYRETMKFAMECLEVFEFINAHKDLLHRYIAISETDDHRYICSRIQDKIYKIVFSETYTDTSNSLYDFARTDYVSYKSWSDSIKIVHKQNTFYSFLTDISEESYFQNSLIYTEKELKMLYIMSYFKKYCKFNTLSFEISAMKVFIKNVKELKRAFNVHRK
ncbi:Uncharacterised protein [Escherichia coli]|nr:Uncharacterised protein [Escherichia coli]VWN21720.1 Uncharacterised protein [Escherichia coli]